jgi:hypothetical protein
MYVVFALENILHLHAGSSYVFSLFLENDLEKRKEVDKQQKECSEFLILADFGCWQRIKESMCWCPYPPHLISLEKIIIILNFRLLRDT